MSDNSIKSKKTYKNVEIKTKVTQQPIQLKFTLRICFDTSLKRGSSGAVVCIMIFKEIS